MVIRRLLDRLTGAHYCDICRARLPRRLTQDAHSAWDHAGDAPPLLIPPPQPSRRIRALPADPDDGTGRSA